MLDQPNADELTSACEKECGVQVQLSKSGAALTTFAIGGPIARFITLNSRDALQRVLRFLKQHAQPVSFIGAGSNLLLSSTGIHSWVLQLGRDFRGLEPIASNRFRMGGGVSLMKASRELARAGFSGIEFAGGIPASAGGAVRMNAGAHGSDMAAILKAVELCQADGSIEIYAAGEFEFAYRFSSIPHDCMITAVEMELQPDVSGRALELREEYLAERKRRQPLTSPCAGSIFKNPSAQQSAGSLIENAGLKGKWCGGAQVSELHANWIINPNRTARSEDVLDLVEQCRSAVRIASGLELKLELVQW
ncbi:MAG: UDP-N-acetylmuramate dehydrogenase [Bdellovibrionales bacterium]|nr:UDP-N-acetylmuramate dehydrogenase [Bdellovibrionales bacterium]